MCRWWSVLGTLLAEAAGQDAQLGIIFPTVQVQNAVYPGSWQHFASPGCS